jgi:hypothetical protein
VPASIATWSGPTGGRPVRIVSEPISLNEPPKVGGPIVPMGSPVAGSTICPYPITSP